MSRMSHRKPWAVLGAVAFAVALVGARSSSAAPSHLAPGAVVALTGTTNLWVGDDQGVIHFVGDPAALAGKSVDWSSRTELTLSQIATLPHGDPWLSTAMVQIGGAIYVPQRDQSLNAA